MIYTFEDSEQYLTADTLEELKQFVGKVEEIKGRTINAVFFSQEGADFFCISPKIATAFPAAKMAGFDIQRVGLLKFFEMLAVRYEAAQEKKG